MDMIQSPFSATMFAQHHASSDLSNTFNSRTGICDLPLELWSEVYLLLLDTDAAKLSVTCKQARAFYDSDLRFGMQSFLPKISPILDLRRPGAMPLWKQEALKAHMLKPRWTDEVTGEEKTFDFFGMGQALVEGAGYKETGWTIEWLSGLKDKRYSNHGAPAKRTLEENRLFLKRILERPMFSHKVLLEYSSKTGEIYPRPTGPAQQWSSAWDPSAVPIATSVAEKERMFDTLCTAVRLELKVPCFALYDGKYVNGTRVAKVAQICDHTPLLKMHLRELWKLTVLLKLVILETGEVENSKSNHGNYPLVNSSNLRAAVAGSLNERTRVLGHTDYGEIVYRTCHWLTCTEYYDRQLTTLDTEDREGFRGIFWDENQETFSYMLNLLQHGLDTELSQIPKREPCLAVLRPLAKDADGPAVCEYVKAIELMERQKGGLVLVGEKYGRTPFTAIRISKDGVLSFDEAGEAVDDCSENGRWAVFKKPELERLCRKRLYDINAGATNKGLEDHNYGSEDCS
ncbi:hypothetical protein BJ508DRAFT_417937 [Ascobolus immersus RN42]|uniref:F-box domain-containing protein n=1 Tax=Ascobolus immersus RN42 TaxID=1160509 RepID=A0A3N4HTL2_ASCIM|nr:hypothetical protein BJ508DRAFT_417937 [Ascobolus immersus RN42]